MRAVRQFQQRWPSPTLQELDERGDCRVDGRITHDAPGCPHPGRQAAARTGGSMSTSSLKTMTRCCCGTTCWATLPKRSATLVRFRVVRRWRLVLDPVAPVHGRAMLEAASGARSSTSTLNGAERRLILFATHGSSRHWTNGAYQGCSRDGPLLSGGRDSAAAGAKLETYALGDPAGLCSTDRVGATSGSSMHIRSGGVTPPTSLTSWCSRWLS